MDIAPHSTIDFDATLIDPANTPGEREMFRRFARSIEQQFTDLGRRLGRIGAADDALKRSWMGL